MAALRRTVVVLHDVEAVRGRSVRYLSGHGLAVIEAGSPREAIACLNTVSADCVVIGKLAAGMPETLRWIAEIHKAKSDIRVVFAPAPDTPAGVPDLPGDDPEWDARQLVGQSRAIRKLREYLQKVAQSSCNVLVTGETGTGKELVAEIIHHTGPRRRKPMVALNCAAIPDALLESELFGVERGAYTGAYQSRNGRLIQAHGGTLFLDEVGELSLSAQAKLLRAIETRRVERLGANGSQAVDVRIVAASNRNLSDLANEGKFRSDLYFRLAVCQLRVPPLRERVEDTPLLCSHFLEILRRSDRVRVRGVQPSLLELLRVHSWPGNIRELRNLLEAMTVEKTEGDLGPEDLPPWFQTASPVADGSTELEERRKLIELMEQVGWNKTAAARTLQCSRVTVYRRLARHHIEGGATSSSDRSLLKSRDMAGRRTAAGVAS
jgi:DNA-binding NtrC family response regulator